MAAGLFRTAGIHWQFPRYGALGSGAYVRLATAADLNGAYTYAAGTKKITGPANTALSNIDGTAAAVGDRVLVKNAATGSNNGIYIVNALGSGASQYELERDFDMSASDEVKGAWFMVLEGTANGGKVFRNTNTGAVTLDTTALTFATSESEIVAGAGLSDTAGTLAVELSATPGLALVGAGDAATLETKNGDGIAVDANGIKVDLAGSSGLELTAADGTGQLQINLDATPGLVLGAGGIKTLNGDGISADANGIKVDLVAAATGGLELSAADGTGQVRIKAGGDANAGVNLLMLKRGSGGAANDGVIYSATFGTTASTTITHGLGKQFCLAQVYDTASPYGTVDANIKMDSTTACTVELASAPGADTRRLVLMAVA